MNLLVAGASRGLGAAFCAHLPRAGDAVWAVSRTPPILPERVGVTHHWLEADLSQRGATGVLERALEGETLDALIYNAGIWEAAAFGPSYAFEAVDDLETERIVTVNLTSAIACARAVLPALRRSSAGKLILIGSTSGLENAGRPEVAYVASKFGLRGVAHALREVLRRERIAVTCLNLGDIGSITVTEGGVSARGFDGRALMDPEDVLEVVRCLLRLSNASCIKELDLSAMTDTV